MGEGLLSSGTGGRRSRGTKLDEDIFTPALPASVRFDVVIPTSLPRLLSVAVATPAQRRVIRIRAPVPRSRYLLSRLCLLSPEAEAGKRGRESTYAGTLSNLPFIQYVHKRPINAERQVMSVRGDC